MATTRNAALIAHLARVEGQLAAVRAALATDDCTKAARTLLAATRSLSSARTQCVQGGMTERVYRGGKLRDKALLHDVEALMKA